MSNEFTSPVGRLVEGSVSELHPRTDPQTKQPKMGKDGQPQMELFFAVAIPKGPEAHWAETHWGSIIWAEGHAGFPNGETQQAGFAWKVVDGDSQVPNQNNKKPADKNGFPGNWILSCSNGFAIGTYNANASAPLDPNEFYRGCFLQVLVQVKANGATGTNTKGVYINPTAVAFAGHGEKITTGPDVSNAGFGVGVVAPVGMSATPLAGMVAPPVTAVPVSPATIATPVAPVAPPIYQAPATATPVVTSPSSPAEGYPQILQPPAPPVG